MQKCVSCTLQIIGCNPVFALNHISDVMMQLNDVRNKLQDTFHDISELASIKTKSLGIALQRPRSASKQIHHVNVSGQTVD
jgi:hypothetical protein